MRPARHRVLPGVRSRPAPRMNSEPRSASNRAQERAKEAEEDRALIAQAQAGDMGAFRQLVERHQRRAFAVALALVRDENDAREIVQDAFLRAFKKPTDLSGELELLHLALPHHHEPQHRSHAKARPPDRGLRREPPGLGRRRRGRLPDARPLRRRRPGRRRAPNARSRRAFSPRSTRCRATTGRSS